MKKIALAAFGLMLAASPAFADSVTGFGNDQANNNTVASNNEVKSHSQTNTNTETTTNTNTSATTKSTSNSYTATDSFNKTSTDVDLDVDVKDSFNKTEVKDSYKTTNKADDSFNTTHKTEVEDSYNTTNKTKNTTTNTTTNTYSASDSFNSTKVENEYDVSAALSLASLSQVSTGNKIDADSKGKFAGAASVNSGSVSGTSVSTSGGVITNNINTGAVSNVGALTAVAASTR